MPNDLLNSEILRYSKIANIFIDNYTKIDESVGFSVMLNPTGKGTNRVYEVVLIVFQGQSAKHVILKVPLDTCIPDYAFWDEEVTVKAALKRMSLVAALANIVQRRCTLEIVMDFPSSHFKDAVVEFTLEYRTYTFGAVVPLAKFKGLISQREQKTY